MKRSFFSILIVLAALSCEEQKGIVPPPVETAELEVDSNELNFTDEGGSKTIGITTNTRWMDAILKLDTGKPVVMPSHHDPEIVKWFMTML